MIEAELFVQACTARGWTLWSGVPCSYLTPFINHVLRSGDLRYVGAANEGDAVALAAGAELGGKRSVVMFQNSGLGNAVNPLTSLAHTFRIPMLLICTLRGDPEGPPDEPQHRLMGSITRRLLEAMEIPYEDFPGEPDQIEPALQRAQRHASGPYALVMRKGTVRESGPPDPPAPGIPRTEQSWGPLQPARKKRGEILRQAQRQHALIVASTGYLSRELYALEDRANQLYMVGSMGCAVSLGLGLALTRPERRVIVLDGDGALLMRMGAMAMVGREAPANLTHVLLDNGRHESTGGQPTLASSVDFCAVAQACGYRNVYRVYGELPPLEDGPTFVHVPIAPGAPDHLPRPSITPEQVAQRLREHLACPV